MSKPKEAKAMIDQIYDQINKVFGGPKDQLFALEFPGRPLAQGTYEYPESGQSDANLVKPPDVSQNEFFLTNDLFSLGTILGGPNGRKFDVAYEEVLNMYLPGDTTELLASQQEKKKWLNEKRTDYGNGTMTRLQVYRELHNKYLTAKQQWFVDKSKQKPKPGASREEIIQYEEWLQNVGEARQSEIDDLYSDMNVTGDAEIVNEYLAFLNYKSPAEFLATAKNALLINKKSFDGSSNIYPVELQPTNWANGLNTDFQPQDLTRDVGHLTELLNTKKQILADLNSQRAIIQLAQTGNVAQLEEAKKKAEAAYSEAETAMITQFAKATIEVVKIVLKNTSGKPTDAQKTSIKDQLAAKGQPISDADLDNLADLVGQSAKNQQVLIDTSERLVELQIALAKAKTTDATIALANLDGKIGQLNEEIRSLDFFIQKIPPGADPKNPVLAPSIVPPTKPSTFEDIIINFSSEDQNTKSKLVADASHTSFSVDLGLLSVGGRFDQESSSFNQSVSDKKIEIEVGLRAMKVAINRPWFDANVFKNTKALVNLRKADNPDFKVSLGQPQKSPNADEFARLENGFLAAYPTAFIVAKDITFRLKFNAVDTAQFHDTFSKSSTIGGGFLCFSASHSESSSSDIQGFTSNVTTEGLDIHITTPQIIGWYLQYVPLDESTSPVKPKPG